MMTTIEPRELNCPVCATTFAAQVLTSTNTLGMRTTDLRTLAAGFQPQEFIVHTCPTCGYSGESDQFLSVGHVVPSVRIDAEMTARIRSSITPLVQRGKIDAARRWELAAWVTEWSGAPDEDIAWHYLNAAWCCQDMRAMDEAARVGGLPRPSHDTVADTQPPMEDDAMNEAQPLAVGDLADRERQYRRYAAARFERMLSAADIADDDREMYTYLIGELYRRAGDQRAAARWFTRVGDGDSEWVALARRQRSDPTEMIQTS